MNLFILLNTNKTFIKYVSNQTVDGPHWLPMEVYLFIYYHGSKWGPSTGWHSLKYLLLCSEEERNSYRFETTWGRVNYDIIKKIKINKWTIPLTFLEIYIHSNFLTIIVNCIYASSDHLSLNQPLD